MLLPQKETRDNDPTHHRKIRTVPDLGSTINQVWFTIHPAVCISSIIDDMEKGRSVAFMVIGIQPFLEYTGMFSEKVWGREEKDCYIGRQGEGGMLLALKPQSFLVVYEREKSIYTGRQVFC